LSIGSGSIVSRGEVYQQWLRWLTQALPGGESMLQRRFLAPYPLLAWRPAFLRRVLPEEAYLFARFLFVLAILLAAVYVYLQPARQISVTRFQIEDLQKEYARLQRENADLTRQLATYTDIRRIEARARKLGYQPPDTHLFIVMSASPVEPIAARQATDVGNAPAAAPHEPWWQWILDWAAERIDLPAYAQARR
jgi:cell division protein FtsB